MLRPDDVLEHSEFAKDFLKPLDAFHQFFGFIHGERSPSRLTVA
jgi:hypothetical protein